ncbi:MAG: preprotein translocase subunit SecG [Planctomycetes bacterium]|nr:preprotein translocase subunit SecG [Planctomycetota bacterium]
MIDIPLAAVSFVMKFIGVIWVLISVVLVLLVLVQKGKGGGLSAAFGGGGGGGLLGSKTGDFLTWVTISLVALWLLLSIVAAKWIVPGGSDLLKTTPPPRASTAPIPDQTGRELASSLETNEPNAVIENQ